MIGDFWESFGKEKDEQRELPQEIIDVLNENLPSNFEYIIDDNGCYRAEPKVDGIYKDGIKITTQTDFNEVPGLYEKLMSIPRDKWDEYLYRTQTALPIKSAQIGDENKRIPIELLSADPIASDEAEFVDGVIRPYPFQTSFSIVFESPEGDVIQIEFRQQAYDSVTEIKFMNVDFPALRIELYRYKPLVDKDERGAHTSRDKQVAATYSVIPTNAQNVEEAVVAVRVFRGLFYGLTKVNGKTLSPGNVKSDLDSARIEGSLRFWENALKLEEKLGVSFDPGAEFPNDDARLFEELKTCFLEEKAILWRHPFDHFSVEKTRSVGEGVPFEDYIGEGSLRYEFREGPIWRSLLGTEFDLYSRTEMRDFVITKIQWDGEHKEKAEVYIADAPGSQWVLSRLYITKEQAEATIDSIGSVREKDRTDL